MVPIFSCYPCGTILLRTKAICSKRIQGFTSISDKYILGNWYISYTIYTQTLSAVMNVRLVFPLKINFNLEYLTVHVFLTFQLGFSRLLT